MNNGKVVVAADKNGNIIGVSQNNPEYGYVRVEHLAALGRTCAGGVRVGIGIVCEGWVV